MTFQQEYQTLERKLQAQVAADNQFFGGTGAAESRYLPNLMPASPVGFVIVAQEPADCAPPYPDEYLEFAATTDWTDCSHRSELATLSGV